jgi:putative transposase
MLKAFKCKLTPTPVQIELLNQHFGCVRFVYNISLAYKKEQYSKYGNSISVYDIKKLLPLWKESEEYAFLKGVNSLSLQKQ